MTPPDVPSDLVVHLARSHGLTRRQAERAVAEVLAYYREPVEAFVQRRHRELKSEGESNAAIYARVQREVAAARFVAGPLSERQIRRIVYG